MKPSFIFRHTGLLRDRWIRLVASLLLFHLAAAGQQRQIRLRNETISTPPRTDVAGMASGLAAQTAAAGLFLVQFDGAVEPAWQAELRSRGVELLKYVPDDAFITKFNNVSPDKVRALSFVRWVGPYRPDHKVHPRLAAAERGALATNQTVLRVQCGDEPSPSPIWNQPLPRGCASERTVDIRKAMGYLRASGKAMVGREGSFGGRPRRRGAAQAAGTIA